MDFKKLLEGDALGQMLNFWRLGLCLFLISGLSLHAEKMSPWGLEVYTWGLEASTDPVYSLNGDDQASVKVKIPKDFRLLDHQADVLNGFEMSEYVPQGDTDDYLWSEIITVQSFKDLSNLPPSAEGILTKIQQNMVLSAPDMKVLSPLQNENKQNYSVASTSMAYISPLGRSEVVVFQAFSGTKSILLLQYAAPLEPGQTPQKLEEILKKKISAIFLLLGEENYPTYHDHR